MADGIFFVKQNAIFDKLLKDLDKYAKEIVTELDAEMGAGIEDMATSAKKRAPVKDNRLRSSIHMQKNAPFNYNLKADAGYAAYVEFGTGPDAQQYVPSLDPEWQEYALTFKKAIPGHNRPQPFFYPSVNEVFPKMVKKMEDIIKK